MSRRTGGWRLRSFLNKCIVHSAKSVGIKAARSK
jgi:hypothetical protein